MTKTFNTKINTAENNCILTGNSARTSRGFALPSGLFQSLMLHKICWGQRPNITFTMQNVPAKSERSGRFMTRDGAKSPHIW